MPPFHKMIQNSLKLTTLRNAFDKMDSNHPIRNFVEQKLLSDLDTKLGGLQERFRRSIQPIPQDSTIRKFPQRICLCWRTG